MAIYPHALPASRLAPAAPPVPPTSTLPPGAGSARLFQLTPGPDYQLHDAVHANCLAFGPRGQRVIELLVEAPVFGDTDPVAAQVPEAAGFDGSDWLALIIDAADPQALADASAAAQHLAQQDIDLRFALVLEGETPPDPTALMTLNRALDGVVLLGPPAAGPDQRVAPWTSAPETAMTLLEHFLIPLGLIGIDLFDVRSMLRQGLGMHRAIGAHCQSSPETVFFTPFGLVETLNTIANDEPLAQAQAAMLWLAGGLDFRLDEFDATGATLADRAPAALKMFGIGISPQMEVGSRSLVLLYG